MSKPVARRRKSIAWRASHLAKRSPADRPREMTARHTWVAAVRVRKAVQDRIVSAFRRHLDGAGPGPTDEELLKFARLAVAEQRLGRNLASARTERGAGDQTAGAPRPVRPRGEQP